MPTLKSKYFKDVDEAIAVAQKLVDEDRDFARDRQVVANFYNGRDTMSSDEAEKENVGNVVNHLFGYSSIDKLRAQINSLFTSGDVIWNIKCDHPRFNVSQNEAIGSYLTSAIATRLRRSRRLRPEWRATSGNLVLHGRDVQVFPDRFDWCPRSSFFYVPQDTQPVRDAIPYAFRAEDLSYEKLIAYRDIAATKSSPWNHAALVEAVNAMRPGSPSNPLVDKPLGGEKTSENTGNSEQNLTDGQINTRSTLPVWYLYEVDHTKPEKPVALHIIARYSILASPNPSTAGYKAPDKDCLLYSSKEHFKSVRHWCVPFFIDTEIGGAPLWNSAVGIGKLNFPRDGDVEEFFNLAMDGAKDAMRTKWAVSDGASREKIQRFFAERQDLLPEGLTPVKVEVSGNYQHSFGIIQILRQLSAEDAGTGTTNAGEGNDELQIQAQERQSAAANLVAARMSDIYDSLDDMGSEIVRRFMGATTSEDHPGYCDVMLFRAEMEKKGVPPEVLKELAETKHGEFLHLEVKTSRALGDGSRMAEMQTAQMLMGSMGAFSPEGQEMIKRRFATTVTRDPDWAKALVPFEETTNPDQIARARNENTAAISRGIIGFVPQTSPDDVGQIHIPEHDSELDSVLKRAEIAGGMDDSSFAGFKSLATHQAAHVQNLRGNKQTAEEANSWLQKLERQTANAEGLQQAHQANRKNDEISALDQQKLAQKERDQLLRERSQASIEQDRETKNDMARREQAVSSTVNMTNAATKAAAVTTAPAPPPQQITP